MSVHEEGSFRGLSGLGVGAILTTGLALSIGWGIRGNFGHEYGAMLPGALAAITVALMSGREDWRRRVAYFALFGALAWGFGGSMSYGHVNAYTHSGDKASQLYGFACLYVIGFLWAGLGGGGTALAGVLDQDRLRRMVGPLLFILTAWAAYALLLRPVLESWTPSADGTWARHEHPLYWFDSDWLEALVALAAVCAYDLVHRMRVRVPVSLAAAMLAILVVGAYLLAIVASPTIALIALAVCGGLVVLFATHPTLVLYAYGGFYGGLFAQRLLIAFGGGRYLHDWLVQYQGMGETARAVAETRQIPVEGLLLANWPDIVLRYPTHLGCILGAAAGVAIYFYRNGEFANGASLYLYMCLGWFAAFLLFPVLLGFGGAGLRMTPPRGDNWAGIVGVFLGAMLWMYRNQLSPVIWTAIVTGTYGGLSFAGAVLFKIIMMWPGNPARGAAVEGWRHWQNTNWHSVMEQVYGFGNGIGLAVALGILASSKGRLPDDPDRGRWGKLFGVTFVLLVIPYLNLVGNVSTWVEKSVVAEKLRAPLFDSVTLTPLVWYNIVFLILAAALVYMMARHLARPLAIVPERPLGRGQLLFVVLLWVMVIGNFERQFPSFAESRLITEWVIALNAILVTTLLIVLPRAGQDVPLIGRSNYQGPIRHALRWAVIMLILASTTCSLIVWGFYGSHPTTTGTTHTRFGPDATWRTEPLLRGERHR